MLKGFQEGCADAHQHDKLEDSGIKLSSLHETEEVEPLVNRFLNDVEIGVFGEGAKQGRFATANVALDEIHATWSFERGNVHADVIDVIVGGQGGREGNSQELVAEGDEVGGGPRSSEDVSQHAGATYRYYFNIAKELALCDVGPAEGDVFAAFSEADIFAESNGSGVVLVENSRGCLNES